MIVKGDDRSGASFSLDEQHRYALWRALETPLFEPSQGPVLFIGLNPSTADHQKSDPTCTREMDFARRWGHDLYLKCNLFGFRSTDPLGLLKAADPVGKDNLVVLQGQARRATRVVLCWGDGKGSAFRTSIAKQSLVVQAALRFTLGNSETTVHCFGATSTGNPRHPLYLKKTTELSFWRLAHGKDEHRMDRAQR